MKTTQSDWPKPGKLNQLPGQMGSQVAKFLSQKIGGCEIYQKWDQISQIHGHKTPFPPSILIHNQFCMFFPMYFQPICPKC